MNRAAGRVCGEEMALKFRVSSIVIGSNLGGIMSMQWEKLLSTTRLGNRAPKDDPGRSPFNSDHDKVIFSGSFRRLARKTQVHPLATNDHVHNRLTHSLEVASVGRTLAIRIGQALEKTKSLPDGFVPADLGDIVQTACLAHDIGNPPFGHTGEEAIRHWFSTQGARYSEMLSPAEFSDLKTFEGNAQGFRVLTCSEFHPYHGGLRLTYASLGSFIKYPWTSLPASEGKRPKTSKYGVYHSEVDIFREVADHTGLITKGDTDWYCRHPLAHVMEIADDFCYGLLDLEDGIEMGILTWDEVFETLRPVLDEDKVDALVNELKGLRDGRKPPLIRGKVISAFVDDATNAFIANEAGFLKGQHDDLLSLCSDKVRICVKRTKDLAQTKVFAHPRKVELEIGAYSTMDTLLRVTCEAAELYVGGEKTFRGKRALDLIGESTFDPRITTGTTQGYTPLYLALMRVMDFVSGMTDNYATHLAKQFSGMGGVR